MAQTQLDKLNGYKQRLQNLQAASKVHLTNFPSLVDQPNGTSAPPASSLGPPSTVAVAPPAASQIVHSPHGAPRSSQHATGINGPMVGSQHATGLVGSMVVTPQQEHLAPLLRELEDSVLTRRQAIKDAVSNAMHDPADIYRGNHHPYSAAPISPQVPSLATLDAERAQSQQLEDQLKRLSAEAAQATAERVAAAGL